MNNETKIKLLEKYIEYLRGTINLYRIKYISILGGNLPFIENINEINYGELEKRFQIEDVEEIS